MNKREMNKEEYIKQKKKQFEKHLQQSFEINNLYVIIFTDVAQSSYYGSCDYYNMYTGNIPWENNVKLLLSGQLKYYQISVDKWITYKCNCGCNAFFAYENWFVCSNCFFEHSIGDFTVTFNETKENRWHKFGIVSKYEFDEFMKECTNKERPEQKV